MTVLSNDRMVDVFPVVFDFKKGEQPSSKKLTKWVRLMDSAFHLVTKAVGDPWDYQSHGLNLSPQKLSQPTLARSMGPSEYVGPLGESINSGPITVEVTLNISGASSWFFGFPFIKATSLVGPEMSSADIQFLVPGNIVFSGDAGYMAYFSNHCGDPRDMKVKGDYHIDFANGVISTAVAIDPTDGNGDLTVTISDLSYIGAGPPWGTHNVIPVWQDDVNTGISIIENVSGPGFYDITLPDHTNELPRVGEPADAPSKSITGAGYPLGVDVVRQGGHQTTFDERPIKDLSYRLPYAVEQSFSNGDVFPDGSIMLWQNSPPRFLPLVEFQFVSATELSISCPPLDDVDSVTANTSGYRIVVVGTSLAEQISYLSAVVRDNAGQGLAFGGPNAFPSVTYAPPMSHDRLRDRFSFSGNRESGWSDFTDEFSSWQTRFTFRESDVPTNPHPQYLHRAGWMAQDQEGNSGNAMRGELVFASEEEPHTGAGNTIPGNGGQLYNTWGVRWGGGPDSTQSRDYQNTSLRWEGSRYGGEGNLWTGESFTDSGYKDLDLRLSFTNPLTGASPWGVTVLPSFAIDTPFMYGALTHTSILGTPLYLRGRSEETTERAKSGGMLAFDFDGNSEMNYVKVLDPDRAAWNILFNEVNMPVPNMSACSCQSPALPKLWTSPNVLHDWHTATSLGDIPSFGRWSSDQIREYRFRGVSQASAPMMGHQSIAAGELAGLPTPLWNIAIDDAPVRAVNNTYNIVVLQGNYLAHLFSGAPFRMNGDGGNQVTGDYYVKWAFYIPQILAATMDYTVVKVVDQTGGPLVSQSVTDGHATVFGQEMASKFTSPSIVGADYFNVYGNALFFSDGGSGANTSFTNRGSLWLDFGHVLEPYIGDQTPSGLFYHPQHADTSTLGAYYAFTVSESDHDGPNLDGRQTRWPLMIGDNFGIRGQSKFVSFYCSNEPSLSSSGYSLFLMDKSSAIDLRSDTDGSELCNLHFGAGRVDLEGEVDIDLTSNGPITLASGSYPTGSTASAVQSFAPLIGLYSGWNSSLPIASGGISIIAGHDAEAGTGQAITDQVRIGAKAKLRLYCDDTTEIEGESITLDSTAGKVQITTDTFFVTESTENTRITGGTGIDLDTTVGDITLDAEGKVVLTHDDGLYFGMLPPGVGYAIGRKSTGQIVDIHASSRRYKTNIALLDNPSWLYNLSPVSFEFKNQPDTTCFGLIAEDVEEIIPEIVSYDAKNRPNGVRYQDLIAPLIKVVQDQNKRIKNLESKLNAMLPID